MAEADLARLHGLRALRHPAQVLAHRDPSRGRVGGHVAVEADPVDRAVRALSLPVVALVELGGEAGELELELVDDLAQADHLVGDLELSRSRLEHAQILRTNVLRVKLIYMQNRSARPLQEPPGPPPHPPSQPSPAH